MPKRRARSPIRLVDVVFLAGTASGTVFSLSNFQMLSGGSVPLNCILAYNTPIRGCRIRDFTEKTCSEECRDSLNEVQNNVQASRQHVDCSDANARDDNPELFHNSVRDTAPSGEHIGVEHHIQRTVYHIYATVVIDDKRVGFGKVNIDDNNPAAEADDPTRKRGGSPFDFVGASSKLRPLDAVLLLSAAGCAAALLVA
ncbi:hypothetical protein ACCO45_008851 [Purpureocillium lilacinum]|uniref:Uncharacterized protein n=1 Tax=Purpureocillium lilacinum TaxID=33203 RepID=A0ACC4DI15_PURLI